MFVLAHERFCAMAGACACAPPHEPHGRPIARSLTITTKHTVDDLPDAILAVAEIAAAVRSGELAVTRQSAVQKVVASPPPARVVQKNTKKARGAK